MDRLTGRPRLGMNLGHRASAAAPTASAGGHVAGGSGSGCAGAASGGVYRGASSVLQQRARAPSMQDPYTRVIGDWHHLRGAANTFEETNRDFQASVKQLGSVSTGY